MNKTIYKKNIGNAQYRIREKRVYIDYDQDELNGATVYPVYSHTDIDIQIRKRFLFINYWSTIKTYSFIKYQAGNIQRYNAIKYLNNLK